MDKIRIDVAIIGGGIVGLATALELKKKKQELEIAVLEAAPFLADHSTGRNSGVLHAGLYYPTNSNKHLLCIQGMELWKQVYCPELGIDYQECGKVIFSKNEQEEDALSELWNKAKSNGVTGLSWLENSQLSKLEKYVTIRKAFFSKNTGILDVTGAVKKIADKFQSIGGMITTDSKVQYLEKQKTFEIELNDYLIECDVVINAGGFFGPSLRKDLGLLDLESELVKGNYISTSQKLDYPHLFYPVPPKDLKGLGVHSTNDLQGNVKFGPNTEDLEEVDYKESKTALNLMKPEILSVFKGIDENRLYWDYAGIRSKLKNLKTGMLENDFWIKSPLQDYIEILGVESPGLTSAPAIAKKIVSDYFS